MHLGKRSTNMHSTRAAIGKKHFEIVEKTPNMLAHQKQWPPVLTENDAHQMYVSLFGITC